MSDSSVIDSFDFMVAMPLMFVSIFIFSATLYVILHMFPAYVASRMRIYSMNPKKARSIALVNLMWSIFGVFLLLFSYENLQLVNSSSVVIKLIPLLLGGPALILVSGGIYNSIRLFEISSSLSNFRSNK